MIGSLFHGTGALDLAVGNVYGGPLAWYAEHDPRVARIGSHHYPDVTNLGDATLLDYDTIGNVSILTGGTPCQDISNAGKRAGMAPGTRSNLWVTMREAIARLQPDLVIWENVRAAVTASAVSDLEPCPRCVGAPDHWPGPPLRALGRVLGDLASLRYDAEWTCLPAAEVGAPHLRWRVFVTAHPQDQRPERP